MNDITVQRIVRAYDCRTDAWKRDFFAPRLYDGIVFFTEGSIEYDFGEKRLLAQKGDVLFLPGNVPYSGVKMSKNVAFYVLDLECAEENEFNETIGACVDSGFEYELLRLKFSEAVAAWKKQLIDVNLELKAFAYYVLHHAARRKGTVKEGAVHTEVILDYIAQSIGDPKLSLAELHRLFFISESQLRRNIYKNTGMNPNQYILKLRLNVAQTELVNTEKSVKAISEDCGFSSPYYFSKCFSKQFGVSPKAYRARFFNT